MAATTEVSRLAASGSDKTYSYAAIATWDGTTIADADLLQVYDNGTLLTLTTHYTVDDVNENIVLVDAYTISTNDRITIKRVTDITTPYVDFVNNSSIESSDLDLAIGQNRFKLQEIETATNNSLQYDIVNNCWDGLGYKACNFASATTNNDLVTYGQVQNLLAGVNTADIDNIVRWSFVGDGSTSSFTLTSAPPGLSSADQLVVTVDGVVQAPTTNYTLSSTLPRTLTTTSAVPTGKILQVFTVQGIVSSIFDEGTVTTTAIVDDAVTLDKINIGVGVADRFLVFDINGDPTGRVIDHTDIPDFDTGVQTNRLDQLAVPTANISVNSNKITDLVAGSLPTDAVNKGQMEAAIATSIATGLQDVEAPITGINLTRNTARSNSGSTFMHVAATVEATVNSSGYTIQFQVKPTASGSWETVQEVTVALGISGGAYSPTGTASFMVPSSYDYRYTSSSFSATVTVTETQAG